MNPILQMTDNELRTMLTNNIKTTKLRASQVMKTYGGSPAVGELKDVYNDGLNFPTQADITKMTQGELRFNVSATNKFLNNKTSTVEGTKEWLQHTFKTVYKKDLTKTGKPLAERTITSKVNKFINEANLSEFWDVLSRVREDDVINLLSSGYGSDDDGEGFRTIVKEYSRDMETYNNDPQALIDALKQIMDERAIASYDEFDF